MNESVGAAVLGALQGLTEFLPVSSSGHLVLGQRFIPISIDAVAFDLVLHVGTLLPVLWFYRETWLQMLRDLLPGVDVPLSERGALQELLWVFIASLPTAILGLSLRDAVHGAFEGTALLAVTFFVTGVLLWASQRWDRSAMATIPSWKMALLIGTVQGVAILPGISRSGSTIAVLLMLGVARERAARLSFLMSVPAILGACLLELRDPSIWIGADPTPMIVGGLTSMLVGYAALVLLVRLVVRGHFAVFRWYVWAMALFAGGITVLV